MTNIYSDIYKTKFCFALVLIAATLLTCNKKDDNICGYEPVFKTEDSIIVLNGSSDKAKIELIICDHNVDYYYTLDGLNPDKNSALYNPDSGIVVGIGDYLIKVAGYLNYKMSDIIEKRFIITYLPLPVLTNFSNHSNYYSPFLLKLKNADEKLTYETTLNDKIIDITEPYGNNKQTGYTFAQRQF
jgi:hypothetical protein